MIFNILFHLLASTPNPESIAECCADAGVPETCFGLCRRYKGALGRTVPPDELCRPHLANIIMCLEKDYPVEEPMPVAECCEVFGVPKTCFGFCIGHKGIGGRAVTSDKWCDPHWPHIIMCLNEDKKRREEKHKSEINLFESLLRNV